MTVKGGAKKAKAAGGACACVTGGSRASDAVESLMTPEAYASMEARLIQGGNSALMNIMSDLKQTMQKMTAGGSVRKDLKTKANARALGQLSNHVLSSLTPYGAKALGKVLSDPKMTRGGSAITFAVNLLDKVLPKAGVKLGGSNLASKDHELIQEFVQQLDADNRAKVSTFMNTATAKTGGSLEAYDELFKNTQFDEYVIKGVKGGASGTKSKAASSNKKATSKTKKSPAIKVRHYGGTTGDLQGAEWPSEFSLQMAPAKSDMIQETPEMARLNAKVNAALLPRDSVSFSESGLKEHGNGAFQQFNF